MCCCWVGSSEYVSSGSSIVLSSPFPYRHSGDSLVGSWVFKSPAVSMELSVPEVLSVFCFVYVDGLLLGVLSIHNGCIFI